MALTFKDQLAVYTDCAMTHQFLLLEKLVEYHDFTFTESNYTITDFLMGGLMCTVKVDYNHNSNHPIDYYIGTDSFIIWADKIIQSELPKISG